MSARIYSISIELEVETTGGTITVTIPSNPTKHDAEGILADMAGEFWIAEDVFTKNPTLLKNFVAVLGGAANYLSFVRDDLTPFFRKLDRLIEKHG